MLWPMRFFLRRNRVPFTALACAVLVAGCASSSGVRKGMPRGENLARLSGNAEKREKASGSGSVSWKTERRNIGATGVLVLEWPRALRLEVQDPLGGMVAFLVLNGENFWSYMEEQGHAVSGSLGSREAARILPLPLSTRDTIRVLLARPPFDEAEVEYGKRPNTLVYEIGERTDIMEWDPSTDEPRVWRLGNKRSPRTYVEAVYSDYQTKAGVGYPGKVRVAVVENGREKLRLTWQWNDLETYIPKISDIFEIPPGWAKNVKTRVL